jgi:hypothetical protein
MYGSGTCDGMHHKTTLYRGAKAEIPHHLVVAVHSESKMEASFDTDWVIDRDWCWVIAAYSWVETFDVAVLLVLMTTLKKAASIGRTPPHDPLQEWDLMETTV